MATVTLDEISAIGVEETLPDEEEFTNDEKDTHKNETVNNETIKTIKINEKTIKKIDDKQITLPDEEGEINLEMDEQGNIKRLQPYPIDPPNPVPNPPNPNPITPLEYRYNEIKQRFLPNKLRLLRHNQSYQLIFSLKEDRSIIKITFDIYGESGTEKVLLEKVKCHSSRMIGGNVLVEACDNYVILKKLQKDILYTLDFTINSEETWSMEVKVYGVNS